jgi:hypothetical protein
MNGPTICRFSPRQGAARGKAAAQIAHTRNDHELKGVTRSLVTKYGIV